MTRKTSWSFLISGKVSSPRFLARAGDKPTGKLSGSQKNTSLKRARMRYLSSGASTLLVPFTVALTVGDSDSMRPAIPVWGVGGPENNTLGDASKITIIVSKATRQTDR